MLWLILAAMTAAVLALLAWPLLRPPGAGAGRRELTLEVYRRQLAELEAEAARGLVGEAERAEARREIERRLLAADAAAEPEGLRRPSWRQGAAVAVLLALPGLAVALYLGLGAPELPGAPWAERQTAAARHADGDMETLVAQLAARMAETPDDPRGWRLLGRSYMGLGRYAEAAAAFQRLLALDEEDVDARLDLAEALSFAAGGQVTPLARVAFEAALARRPESARARYYLGLASWQAGAPQAAYDRWLALAREAPADAPWLPLVVERLKAAAAQLGIDLAADLPAAEGPSAAEVAAAAQMPAAERQAMIRNMVEGLAARLETAPDDFEGWMRLGRARRVLDEPAAAAAAYARAAALRPEATEPAAEHLLALLAAGELEAAEARWRELAPRLDPAGPEHRQLSQALEAARRAAR